MAKAELKNVVVLKLQEININSLEDKLNKLYELGYRVICSCDVYNEIIILEKKW